MEMPCSKACCVWLADHCGKAEWYAKVPVKTRQRQHHLCEHCVTLLFMKTHLKGGQHIAMPLVCPLQLASQYSSAELSWILSELKGLRSFLDRNSQFANPVIAERWVHTEWNFNFGRLLITTSFICLI